MTLDKGLLGITAVVYCGETNLDKRIATIPVREESAFVEMLDYCGAIKTSTDTSVSFELPRHVDWVRKYLLDFRKILPKVELHRRRSFRHQADFPDDALDPNWSDGLLEDDIDVVERWLDIRFQEYVTVAKKAQDYVRNEKGERGGWQSLYESNIFRDPEDATSCHRAVSPLQLPSPQLDESFPFAHAIPEANRPRSSLSMLSVASSLEQLETYLNYVPAVARKLFRTLGFNNAGEELPASTTTLNESVVSPENPRYVGIPIALAEQLTEWESSPRALEARTRRVTSPRVTIVETEGSASE
ncbi:hypothetical protein MBLNU459_g5930t1 [Dothideomycetes sp. NU459]